MSTPLDRAAVAKFCFAVAILCLLTLASDLVGLPWWPIWIGASVLYGLGRMGIAYVLRRRAAQGESRS